MNAVCFNSLAQLRDHFDGALRRILELQKSDGSIPWFDNGIFDPWNHIEATMALDVLGASEAASSAYSHLVETQNPDGSWWAQYGAMTPLEGVEHEEEHAQPDPQKRIKDTNFSAYIATGAWHRYLLSGDVGQTEHLWPSVVEALRFVERMQAPTGEVAWAADADGSPADDALISGNASIYKSLECGIHLAQVIGDEAQIKAWKTVREGIKHCFLKMPERFDRQWGAKDHFAMDWYYPVLAGIIQGQEAQNHLEDRWEIFVVTGRGCRCVNTKPWITVAESAELALTLLKVGDEKRAQELLAWQEQFRAPCGAYWMGYQYEMERAWPEERTGWTIGAVVLAHDALARTSSASGLFTSTLT